MIFKIKSKQTYVENDSFLSEWTLKYLKLFKNTTYLGKSNHFWKPERS